MPGSLLSPAVPPFPAPLRTVCWPESRLQVRAPLDLFSSRQGPITTGFSAWRSLALPPKAAWQTWLLLRNMQPLIILCSTVAGSTEPRRLDLLAGSTLAGRLMSQLSLHTFQIFTVRPCPGHVQMHRTLGVADPTSPADQTKSQPTS